LNNIKVVIPARYGSTRLPGKPLLPICGMPMVYHVVQQCLSANISFDSIIVATDDRRIVDAMNEFNIPVRLTSSEHQSGTDRIHEIAILENWKDGDVVLNIQGDEPLIPHKLINEVANFALQNRNFSITTAVTRISKQTDFLNPNVVKAILGEKNRALHFTRSAAPYNREKPSDLSLAFRHVGIYAYSVSALKEFCSYSESPLEQYEKLEQLRATSNGMSIGSVVYDGDIPHGIDTKEDYQEIKELMEREKNNGFQVNSNS